jgi:hypothetical protein
MHRYLVLIILLGEASEHLAYEKKSLMKALLPIRLKWREIYKKNRIASYAG